MILKIIFMFLLVLPFLSIEGEALLVNSFNNTLTIENLTYSSGGGNFLRYFNLSSDDFVKYARIDLTPYNTSDYQNFTCKNCGNSSYTFNSANLNQYFNNSYIITAINGTVAQSTAKAIIMRIDNNFTRMGDLLRITTALDQFSSKSFVDNDGDLWNVQKEASGKEHLIEKDGWSDSLKRDVSYGNQDIYMIESVSYNSIDNTIMASTKTATNNNRYIHLLNGSGTIISNCSIGSGTLCAGTDSCNVAELRYDITNNKTYGWINLLSASDNMTFYEIDMHSSGDSCEFKNEILPNEFPTKYSNVNQGAGYGYIFNNNTNSFIISFPNSTATNLVFAVRNHSSPSSFRIDSSNDGNYDINNAPLNTLQNNIDFNATSLNNWLKSNCASGQCYVPLNFSSLSHGIVQLSDINLTINDRPSISSVSIINSTGGSYIDSNTDANCSLSASDNDNSTFLYFFKWFKDGTGNLGFNVQTLAKGNYTSNNKINCTVIVSDGYVNTTETSSSLVTIGDSSPPNVYNVTLINSTGFNLNSTTFFSDLYINITANVTDSGTINQVLAEINLPDNTKTNITLSLSSGNVYVGKYDPSGLMQIGTFNITYIHAQEGNNWNHLAINNLNFTTISRSLRIFNATVSPSSGTGSTSFNISWLAETDGSITLSSCTLLIRNNNNGNHQSYDTSTGISQGSGLSWTFIKTGTQLGGDVTSGYDYNVTNVSCTDANSNTNLTIEFNGLGITVTTSSGGGTGGGGGSGEIQEIKQAISEIPICGDGYCDPKSESLFGCQKDCAVNIDDAFDYILCLPTSKRCSLKEAWFVNILIIGIIVYIGYNYWKRKK